MLLLWLIDAGSV